MEPSNMNVAKLHITRLPTEIIANIVRLADGSSVVRLCQTCQSLAAQIEHYLYSVARTSGDSHAAFLAIRKRSAPTCLKKLHSMNVPIHIPRGANGTKIYPLNEAIDIHLVEVAETLLQHGAGEAIFPNITHYDIDLDDNEDYYWFWSQEKQKYTQNRQDHNRISNPLWNAIEWCVDCGGLTSRWHEIVRPLNRYDSTIIQFLLDDGVPTWHEDWDDSPLHHAARTNNVQAIKAILARDKGAYVNCRPRKTGQLPADAAMVCLRREFKINPKLNIRDSSAWRILEILASHGACISFNLPLKNAPSDFEVQLVHHLLELGCNPTIPGKRNILHWVARSESARSFGADISTLPAILSLALKAGADINMRDSKKKETPLQAAVRCKHYRFARMLVDVDPNSQDPVSKITLGMLIQHLGS